MVQPRSVSYIVRCYRLLLKLYPPLFREKYEREMLQVFSACCMAGHNERGWWGIFSLSVHTLIDLLVTGLQERWHSWMHNDEWERNSPMLEPTDAQRPFAEEVTSALNQQPDYYHLFVSQIESLQSVGAVADCLSLDGDLSDPDALFALFHDADEAEKSAPQWLARLTSAVRQSLHDVSRGPSATVTSQMIERIYANPVLFELIAAEEVGHQLVDVVESLALDGNAEDIDEMLTLMQKLGDQEPTRL